MDTIKSQSRTSTALGKPLIVIAALVIASTTALAQRLSTPVTPTSITPGEGNVAYFAGHAIGTQGYVCLPTATGASWTVNPSRPEATLFTTVFGHDIQVITHFFSPDTNPNADAPSPLPVGSPTWQSSLDSSVVWAKVYGPPLTAGTDSSCPNAGSIPCLLLQSIGSKPGPTGGKALTKTTYIQRLNTAGGTAPATGCFVSTDAGKQALVPYTADYYFFRADN